jgi:16S rRNA (guanine527-N7)-methyltransferase
VAVSRETDVPPADVLARLFPDDKAIHRYVDLLTSAGVDRGLLGPREVSRVWARHILNCAVIESMLPRRASVVDIGSGAGLPGLVLALARPDLSVTLLEPLLRRATFLTEVVQELRLERVDVVRARAEELARTRGGTFDVVTARAVAPLTRLVPWAMPLCRPGGELIAMKGSSAAAEVAEAEPVIARSGGRDVRIEVLGVGLVEPPTTVVRIQSIGQVSPSGKGRR